MFVHNPVPTPLLNATDVLTLVYIIYIICSLLFYFFLAYCMGRFERLLSDILEELKKQGGK